MRRGSRLGKASIAFGVIAIVFAVISSHATAVRPGDSAYVLLWLDSVGLVREPSPNSVAEFNSTSPLLLTDEIAIQWLLVHSWWFSACSVLFALWAEHRREVTLFLSAGFMCGASALVFSSIVWSLAAMVVGGLAMAGLRASRARSGL